MTKEGNSGVGRLIKPAHKIALMLNRGNYHALFPVNQTSVILVNPTFHNRRLFPRMRPQDWLTDNFRTAPGFLPAKIINTHTSIILLKGV